MSKFQVPTSTGVGCGDDTQRHTYKYTDQTQGKIILLLTFHINVCVNMVCLEVTVSIICLKILMSLGRLLKGVKRAPKAKMLALETHFLASRFNVTKESRKNSISDFFS